MPNHVHGLLVLSEGDGDTSEVRRCPNLNTVVGAFKSAATRRVNSLWNTAGASVWQRSYYERVVRTDGALERIREYVVGNPAAWDRDEETPDRIG